MLSLRILLVPLLVLLPLAAQAKLLGVSVSPKQGSADITQGQSFNVRWRVSTTPAHQGGASSSQGQIIDPVTSAVLFSVNHPLAQETGAGPFAFEETLNLTATQLQEWQTRGITALHYQRSFGSRTGEPSVTTGELTIGLRSQEDASLPRAPAAGLFMHRLAIRFENARNRRSFPAGSALRARASLYYSGAGLLHGQWQIAPDNGEPTLFQPLADVRKLLALDNKREYLVSPELPTTKAGKFRVRFCVIPLVMSLDRLVLDSQCPEPELTAEMSYQVGMDNSREPAEIELLTPKAITMTPTTLLQWKGIPEAVAYQLQIFKSNPGAEVEGADFIVRMTTSAEQTRLHLSDWARQQLQPGQQYRWRITAHNENAQLIGRSLFAEFTWLP